jgi:hypothetical protein
MLHDTFLALAHPPHHRPLCSLTHAELAPGGDTSSTPLAGAMATFIAVSDIKLDGLLDADGVTNTDPYVSAFACSSLEWP